MIVFAIITRYKINYFHDYCHDCFYDKYHDKNNNPKGDYFAQSYFPISHGYFHHYYHDYSHDCVLDYDTTVATIAVVAAGVRPRYESTNVIAADGSYRIRGTAARTAF